jgi:tetrapyrrole methylase family protein/MazG family protein
METLPHIQKTPQSEAEWFDALVGLARYLRSPDGCPWDRKQTALSFARYVQEEAAEYVQACEEGGEDHIEEEWGDVLFTLLASAAAAETQGQFRLIRALERAHEKMVRRHGHIFGGQTAETPEDVVNLWNRIKAEERNPPTGRHDE